MNSEDDVGVYCGRSCLGGLDMVVWDATRGHARKRVPAAERPPVFVLSRLNRLWKVK